MDGDRFEALARLVTASSRRGALRCLAGAVLALGWVTRRPAGGLARKRKRKPAFNAFGCVPVGKPCRGKNGVCCSGVCQGKKPKKGKPDRSRCAAHNTGGGRAGLRAEPRRPLRGGRPVPGHHRQRGLLRPGAGRRLRRLPAGRRLPRGHVRGRRGLRRLPQWLLPRDRRPRLRSRRRLSARRPIAQIGRSELFAVTTRTPRATRAATPPCAASAPGWRGRRHLPRRPSCRRRHPWLLHRRLHLR